MSLDDIKNRIKDTPISSIVGNYIPISKKGANYEAICPFHADTKPSLKVNDNKGIFKCFVCETAGDSIKFVTLYKNVEFIDAIKEIAQSLGIPTDELDKPKKSNPKFDMGLRVLSSAFKFYNKVAADTKPPQFHEFTKNRELTNETVEKFGVGYAPANNGFHHYLQSVPEKDRSFAISCAEEIGIVRQGKWGHYDFFRDRVTFPIWDHYGAVRGFSSRAVMPDQAPKYLNSGESFIFDKGNILYGFNFAKNSIREKDAAILVEGNMDVIMLHQYGFTNSVGTMGTAISQNSVNTLSHHTKNIFLGLDSDAAGMKAMQRINASFMEKEILPKYLDFSPEKDPDDFLKKHGQLELLERMETCTTFLDFQIQQVIPESRPDNADQKLKVLREIFHLVAPLKENLMAKERIINGAEQLGIQSTKEDIIDEYKTFLSSMSKKQYKPHAMPQFKEEATKESQDNITDRIQRALITQGTKLPKSEKLFLREMITHPECMKHSTIPEILDNLSNNEVKELVQWLLDIYFEIDEKEYLSIVQNFISTKQFSSDLSNTVNSALFAYNSTKLNEKIVDKLLKDCNFRIQEEKMKTKKKVLIDQQKDCVNQEENTVLLKKIKEIDSELISLKRS